MRLKTFSGGVHLYEGKELSKDRSIRTVRPEGEMVYPLQQHIGAPAKPLVKRGDRVLAGQKIAEADGFVSVPVHASVSGTVRTIEPRTVANGGKALCIVVENDGQYEEITWPAKREYTAMCREEIIGAVQEAGIVGLGGAGFPTHVKLSPKEPDKIDTVIVNCAECEPYLTSDYRILAEYLTEVTEGLKIILSLFPNARGIFAIEDNKRDIAKKIQEQTANDANISVQLLQTKYPQGGERQIIYAVTGRAFDRRRLPADVGCIVQNAATVYSVYRAVEEGRPLTDRVLTVTGDAVEEPCNYQAPVGTSYEELVKLAGGFAKEPEKIINGGPMMGNAMFTLNVPVAKNTSALVCMTRDEASLYDATPCIRCGRCMEVCPQRLAPNRLAEYSERNDREGFQAFYGLECIECGSCSYICPARRHLVQHIRRMKRDVLADRKKAAGDK